MLSPAVFLSLLLQTYLDKFHLKYDERESFPNRTVFQKIYKRLRRDLKYRVIKERDLHAVDQRVFQKKRFRNKYLHGYWQHTGYFEPYLKEITDMMTPAYGQSELVKKLCAEFQTTDTCAVHVRGGDIVGPGRAFFERALARMEKERPGLRYLVFTNDKEAAKEALEGAFSDIDEFFLMAACRHQIISNSSYSTWAAYLNPNPEKVVIMPEYKGCEQIRLKEWIVL